MSDTVPFFGAESPKPGNNNGRQPRADPEEEFHSRAVHFDAGERSTKRKASDRTDRLESKYSSFEWDRRDLIRSLDP